MGKGIAVITGASAGFGRELARLLAKEPDVEEIWDFILDGETELALQIRDYMTRKRDQRLIDLSGLPPRPPRMTRIRMRLQYLDLHTCLVQVRDMGFGEIMPASGEGNAMVKAGIADNRGSILAGGRIWEMTLEV